MSRQKTSTTSLILAIIALGSICGFVEVVLGGLLKQAEFAHRSAILVGLGFAVIAFSLAIFKKPVIAIFIGIIAIMSKNLAVVMLHLPVMCMANSSLAVLLEYGVLGGIAALAMNGMQKNTGNRVLIGGSAAVLSSIAFYFIGMRLAPCNHLLSFNSTVGFFSFLLEESLPWTISAIVLFPIGWLVGDKFASRVPAILDSRPGLYYIGSLLATAVCWTLCAVAISNGL
jgi:hypothetical protein